MAIKKKERVLTPDEFKAKQKRDYEYFWINSNVIFGANLYPVDDHFTKQVSILFLLDPADFTTERAVDLIQNWKIKYDKLQWDAILVFQQKYAFMKNPKFFDRFKNQKIFIDTFGELFERFGSKKEPVSVVLKNGEFISSMPLLPNFLDMSYQLEQQLQSTLRMEDPGLPLSKSEKWSKKNVPMEQQNITPDQVTTFGEWNGTANLLMTEKNNSVLSIPFKGKFLRLVAMAHPTSRDPIKVSITFNEKPLATSIQTSVVHEDNSGVTSIELNKNNGIYDLIQSDTPLTGVVKLTFINTYDNGAIFYEFKIAS